MRISLLNVPPDRRGQIFESDTLALKTFRDVLEKAMSQDLPHLLHYPPVEPYEPLAVVTEGSGQSAVVSREFDVAPADWRVICATGDKPDNPAGTGEFADIAVNRSAQAIRFDAPHSGSYLRLLLPHATQGRRIIGINGIGILTRK